MLITLNCAKCIGIEAVRVTVEVDVRNGIGIHLVGLADTAVKESLLRTVTSLQALDFHVPGRKIVINLAPADLHKSGSGYDLPIALGIIAASGQRFFKGIDQYLIMGELGLDGTVREVPGALPITEMALRAGLEGCILPLRSALEAAAFRETRVFAVRSLSDAVRILEDPDACTDLLVWNTPEYLALTRDPEEQKPGDYMDFAEIVGQEGAKRAMEIAAAGGHNIIMIGPPGSGKSSLAKALAGILPPMTREEALVTSKLYSVAGKGLATGGLMRERPVRSPHCSASIASIIGGGNADNILPGEVSLAQNGVLFLDEIAQMPRSTIEALRAPLEDRRVTVTRLKSRVTFPASFMLVAASNPCPCGYYGEGERCTCTPSQRLGYMSKLSGPILDRIDLQVWLHPVDAAALVRSRTAAGPVPASGSSRVPGPTPDGDYVDAAGQHAIDCGAGSVETSAAVAARVALARRIQQERFAGTGIQSNSEMSSRQLEQFCPLDAPCREMLQRLVERLGLSARAYTRVIKIARTIADLEAASAAPAPGPAPGPLRPVHLAEAASYRFLDRKDVLTFY